MTEKIKIFEPAGCTHGPQRFVAQTMGALGMGYECPLTKTIVSAAGGGQGLHWSCHDGGCVWHWTRNKTTNLQEANRRS